MKTITKRGLPVEKVKTPHRPKRTTHQALCHRGIDGRIVQVDRPGCRPFELDGPAKGVATTSVIMNKPFMKG